MTNKPYYFDNPQLYKMPPVYVEMGAAEEDTLTKALPFIAGGIALFVAYNVFFGAK